MSRIRPRLTGVLASLAFLLALSVPGSPAVFADSNHGNSGNAPGNDKSSQTAQPNANAPAASPSSGPGNSSRTSTTAGTTPSPAPGNSDHSQGTAGTSGSVSQPQPYSTADRNNTGANDTGSTNPYRSTRNGSPSLNGNGNGQATGKPCAGCVGKADNKNPPGQQPNGSDHNAGYECDRNNGIGKSNPAHTGCTATPPPCTGTNCGGHGGCTINCGQGGCQTNCGNNNCVPTTVNTCVPVSECTAISCVPGRGGGHVLGASTVLAAVTGNALPNTSGAGGGLNWPAILAVVSLIGAAVYWRQLVVPLLPKE